jgi:arylsulfatase A-like enzyme
MTIPWIISGPEIRTGQFTTPINITDTAATVVYALGLSIPSEWDGVPVLEAFGLPHENLPNGTRCPIQF